MGLCGNFTDQLGRKAIEVDVEAIKNQIRGDYRKKNSDHSKT